MGASSRSDSAQTRKHGARLGLRVCLAGNVLLLAGFLACGSDGGPSATTEPEREPDASSTKPFVPADGSQSTRDSSTNEPRECAPPIVGNGPEASDEAYLGLCSPKCGAGQFCFSFGDTLRDAFDSDAGDVRATVFNAYPLLCRGCHPMPECDGGDPCACLRAQLAEDVCDDGGGSQCRVRDDGSVQFRCLTKTHL